MKVKRPSVILYWHIVVENCSSLLIQLLKLVAGKTRSLLVLCQVDVDSQGNKFVSIA